MSLSALLASAGVSRTAYYSLIRRGTVLPTSVIALAEGLAPAGRAWMDETPLIEPNGIAAVSCRVLLRGPFRVAIPG